MEGKMHKKVILFLIMLCIVYFSNVVFAETITLKSGKKIEGKIIEKTDKYIKLDFYGASLTYFIDEIEFIDGQKIANKESSDNSGKKIDLEKTEKSVSDVSSEINAAVIYKESIANLKGIPDNFIDKTKDVINNGWLPEHNDLKEILSQNQKAIDEFKRAAQLTHCDFTFGKIVEKTASSPLPISGNIFTPARLVLLEARLYEKENKMDLALKDYISILKFKNHLDRQENFILFFKTAGIITQKLIYAPLTQYIIRKDLTLLECRALQDALLFMKDNRIGLEKVFEEEKEISRNTIRGLGVEAKPRGKYNENFYQTLYKEFDNLSDEFSRYLIESVRENRPEIYEEKINAFNKELKKERIKLLIGGLKNLISLRSLDDIRGQSPFYIAKILVSLGASQYRRIITRYYVALAEFNALLAGVTVKLYEIKNSQTPDSLQKLIPDYIPALPEDPFDSFKPLKFKKREKGWVIYSFGPDRSDNQANIIHSGKEESIDEVGDIVFLSQ